MKIRLTSLLACTLTLTAFYSTTALANTCPPAQKVKSMSLKQAVFLYKTRWSLVSDTFIDYYRDWNTYFIVDLPNATNKTQALQQGREAFQKASITQPNPIPYNSDGITYCDYAKEATYVITAAAMVNDGKVNS